MSIYGFDEAATAIDNGIALTAAAVAVSPNGEVTIGPGNFDLVGAEIASGVSIVIDDGCTLTGVRGSADPMIQNALSSLKVTAAAGSSDIVLDSIIGLQAGDRITIPGAGEVFDGVQLAHHATITSVLSRGIVIAPPVSTAVADVSATVGASNIHISGGVLNGDRDGVTADPNHFQIRFSHASNCSVKNTTITEGNHGAVMIDRGSVHCEISGNTISNIGTETTGSGVWIFRSSDYNIVSNNDVDNCLLGITLDDRTSGASDDDGSCQYNIVSDNRISNSGRDGIVVASSSYNDIIRNTVTATVDRGISMRNSQQGVSEFHEAVANNVVDNIIDTANDGLYLDGTNTVHTGNTFSNCVTDIEDNEA